MSSLESIRPMVATLTETDLSRDYTGKPMLIYRRTSLLESTAQTLVNTVNCVGVMGKGIAKDFKERDPEMFAAYKKICDEKRLSPGKLWLWKGASSWILSFPTKQHWRYPSKITWIESGLKKFVASYEALGINEISFPRLGCGNGGLKWDDVRPVMERYLRALPIQVYIHDFTVDVGLPEHMETVAHQLKDELVVGATFESFLAAIERAVELSSDKFVEIDSKQPITASMSKEHILKVESDRTSWSFETEDLWGVWIGLQKGLLTKDKAAWSQGGAGDSLLSILSVLPHVRPVQIQGIKRAPEVALEYRPGERGSVVAPSSKGQLELAWH
jgi:O-acetyl-ADP-ribose deacetylase (regulator of RNase III)